MKGYHIFIFINILAVSLSLVDSQHWSHFQATHNRQPVRTANYNSYGNNGITPEPTTASKQQQTSYSRGIGAWGYIGIILTVILSGMGLYYFVIFYPIVCKKERMYDVMEMTAV